MGDSSTHTVVKKLIPLLILPFVFPVLSAQEKPAPQEVILASKAPPLPIGQTMETTDKFSMADSTIKMQFDDQEFGGTVSASDTEKQHWEFLSPTKIRVTFVEHTSLSVTKMLGEEDVEKTEGAVMGKVVLFEEKDGTWSGTLKEGKVEKDQQEEFDEEIDDLEKVLNDDVEENIKMYGLKPRKIGESWKVDPTSLPSIDFMEVQGGNVWLKLIDVKNFNDEPCAVLEAKLDLTGHFIDEEMEGMNAKLSGSMRVIRSLKYFADYKIAGDMEFKMSGDMEIQPGFVAQYSSEGKMKMTIRSTFLDKK